MRTSGKQICILLLLFFLSAVLIVPAKAEGTISGDAGNGLVWELDGEGVLRISGEGTMQDYTYLGDAPWLEYADLVRSAEIGQGVLSVGAYAFLNCTELTAVSLPEGVMSIGIQAFTNCLSLSSVYLPASCTSVGDYAFRNCPSLRSVEFAGDAPVIGENSFFALTAAAYCSCLRSGWDETTMLPYGANKLTWSLHAWDDGTVFQEATCTEDGILRQQCAVCLDVQDTAIPAPGHRPVTDEAVAPAAGTSGLTEGSHCEVCGAVLQAQQVIPALGYVVTIPGAKEGDLFEIDGAVFTADSTGRIVLNEPGAAFAVKFSWKDPAAADPHKNYPTGMQVFRLNWSEDGNANAAHLAELDNVLQYAGASIRITGKKGIRMISAVPEETRKKLTGSGIEGFTLLEYGTLVQWDSELKGTALTFAVPGVRSAAAFEAGKSDPIFARTSGKIQFTNVLVGFSDEQCGPDLAMRPYMKLLDPAGKTVILYGGTVHRSIGYIALQNKDAFSSGTAAYQYIQSIIRNVYPNA